MALITLSDIKELLPDIPATDDQFQSALDFCDSLIVDRAGPHTGSRTVYEPVYGSPVFLPQKALAVSRIRGFTSLPATEEITEFTLGHEGYAVYSNDGYFGYPAVEITFTVYDDTKLRKQVLVEMVRVTLAQSGYTSTKAGNVSLSYRDAVMERDRLVSSLIPLRIS